jgi:hypothetical protein
MAGTTEWMEVDEIDAAENTSAIISRFTPCTKYQFAVSAVMIDGEGEETETEKQLGPEIMTELSQTTPYKIPRFTPKARKDKLDIVWQNSDCIDYYVIKACLKDTLYTSCPYNATVTQTNYGSTGVSHTITGLTTCTEYNIHIIPVVIGKGEFPSVPETVSTSDGTPEAPEFNITIKEGTFEVSINWIPIICASGYKVYYRTANESESEAVKVAPNSENEMIFTNNLPCQTYSYAVTTMFNEEESPRAEKDWKYVVMPPDTELLHTLKMVDHDEGKVTLKIELPDENEHCAIEQYKVVYSNGENCCENSCTSQTRAFTPDELKNGDIVLNINGTPENVYFKSRVLYRNHEQWSKEAEYIGDDNSRKTCGGNANTGKLPLVPIVGGVAVLILVATVITVLMMKRNRYRNIDHGKDSNNKTERRYQHVQNILHVDHEETQKLNKSDNDTVYVESKHRNESSSNHSYVLISQNEEVHKLDDVQANSEMLENCTETQNIGSCPNVMSDGRKESQKLNETYAHPEKVEQDNTIEDINEEQECTNSVTRHAFKLNSHSADDDEIENSNGKENIYDDGNVEGNNELETRESNQSLKNQAEVENDNTKETNISPENAVNIGEVQK